MCSTVAAVPDALAVKLRAVTEAVRKKDLPAAIAAAEILYAAAPNRPDSQLRALQAFLQAGLVDRAGAVAAASRLNWKDAPRLAHLAMLAFGRTGQRSAAAEAGRSALKGGPQDPKLAATVADALIQAGYPTEALKALLESGLERSEDRRAWYEYARALHYIGSRSEEALIAAQHALELDQENIRVVELVARLMLDLGMADQGLALLGKVAEERRNPTVRMLQVEAMFAVGRIDEGLPLALELAADHLGSLPITRRIIALLSKARRKDEAGSIYDRSLAERRSRLPATFAEGLVGIMGQDYPCAPIIPPQRIDWLWSRLVAASRAPADRNVWERELRQVIALDRLILEWIECRPDALSEPERFIDGVATARQTLARARENGAGVFLAAAHVGLMFGGLAALADSDLPITFVASVPNLGRAAHDAHLVSTSGQDNSAIGRSLYRAITNGNVVSVAIEGGAAKDSDRYPLFDRMIPVSTFIPRLAWKTRTPSFFPLVVWTGSRAKVTVTRLPEADRYRSVEAYQTAWMRAYLSCVERALLEHPNSARAAGGFWGTISF